MHSAELDGRRISSVRILGAPAAFALETHAGDLGDSSKVQRDVKALCNWQRCSDVRVEATADGADGADVGLVFKVQGRHAWRVEKIRVDPPTPGINLGIASGEELDMQAAQQVARGVRRQLESSGFPDAAVDARLLPAGTGKADLRIHIDKGQQLDIAGVSFSGDLGMKPSKVRKALRTTKAKTMIPGLWRILPGYSWEAAQSDAANVRSFYYTHGYFDADVKVDRVDFGNGKARIAYGIESGPRYQMRAFPSTAALCRELFAERRSAERSGVLDFSARLDIRNADAQNRVDATVALERGPAYHVGRIEFRGNRLVNDATVRRALLIDEGALLDETLLRRSLAQLNQTGFFEPLGENNAVVNTPPGSDRADVTIWLKEKKKRNWYLSGPVGPMSIAGPLEFAIGSRLPPWGRGLLELSTYTVSAHFMFFAKPLSTLLPFLPNRRFLPLLTIQRPVLPGGQIWSGFTIAPQLGWQGMLAGYGMSQTRGLLRRVFESPRALTTVLPVTIAKEGSDVGIMNCAVPRTKFDRVRQIGRAATNHMF
jgi:outer membrane protein insertion porin family